MVLTPSESQILLRHNKMLANATIRVVVMFDTGSNPSEEALKMYRKMLETMGYRTPEIQHIYGSSQSADQTLAEAQARFNPALMLTFGVFPGATEEAQVEKQSGTPLVHLPALPKIESDIACKRAIWSVLKPLSGL